MCCEARSPVVKTAARLSCFRPNAVWLYDMVGNVREVTVDLYRPEHDPADLTNRLISQCSDKHWIQRFDCALALA